jgi:hypothetical protein
MRRRVFIAGLIAVARGRSIDLAPAATSSCASAAAPDSADMLPSSSAILIYSPLNATREGLDELKALLKRAGHKRSRSIATRVVSGALTASPFDVVIADYLDADRLKSDLQSASSRGAAADTEHPSKAIEPRRCGSIAFLITPHAMTKFDALAEIDRLMDSRSRARQASK